MCRKIPGLKHGCWERNRGKTPIHPLNLNHKNFIPRSTNWNVIGFQLPVWPEWNDLMMSRFQRQTAPRGRQSVETTVSRIKSRNMTSEDRFNSARPESWAASSDCYSADEGRVSAETTWEAGRRKTSRHWFCFCFFLNMQSLLNESRISISVSVKQPYS